jgi:hypothetical protein
MDTTRNAVQKGGGISRECVELAGVPVGKIMTILTEYGVEGRVVASRGSSHPKEGDGG